MKRLLLIMLLSAIALPNIFAQTAFTPGNLVILREGDGTVALSGNAAPVFLDEYTTAGVLVRSVAMPTTVAGSNVRLVNSGSAGSEGFLTRSVDNRYLIIAGYDAAPATTGIAATTAAAVNRVIGRVAYDGTIDVTTKFTAAYSANNIRSACSVDGTGFWAAGTASSPNGSVQYIPYGTTTTANQLSTTITNVRGVNIFNNQLYCSSATGTFLGVSAVGTGLPITSGQTIAALPGMPSTGTHSNYGFAMNSTGTVMYVADDGTGANGGGIQKWTFNGTTWSLAYVLGTAVRHVTVDWSGANPVIYASDNITSANKVYKVTDTGSGSVVSTFLTAGTNLGFRGISFAPFLPPPSTAAATSIHTTDFTANWNSYAGATTYELLVSTDPAFGAGTIVKDTTMTGLTKLVNGLTPNTPYYYKIKTDNFATYSSYTTVTTASLAIVLTPASDSVPPTYTELAAPITITGSIVVGGADVTGSINLTSGTVQVMSPTYQNDASGSDVLAFTNTASITGSWNQTTGVLTLTSVNPAGTTALDFQNALNSVTYSNTSHNPGSTSRIIQFTLFDSQSPVNSGFVSRTVNVSPVNELAVLTLSGTDLLPLNYNEAAPATAVVSTLGLTDIDNTTMATASVTLTGFVAAEDVLTYTTSGGITGTYNAATGVLNLSSPVALTSMMGSLSVKSVNSVNSVMGSALNKQPIATWITVLRSIKYQNTSLNPSGTPRVLSITINDGTSSSAAITRTINVTPINNAPAIIAPISATVNEAGKVDFFVSGSDPDHDNYSISFKITQGPQHGTLKVRGKLFDTNSLYPDIVDAVLTYQQDGSRNTTDTFKFILQDPLGAQSAEGTFTITVNLVAQYTVSLTSNPDGAGTLSGGGTFETGSSLTVSETPNTGFYFLNWSEGSAVQATTGSYKFTLAANRNLIANFGVVQDTVTMAASPADGGKTTGAGIYGYSSSVIATATPNPGYAFVNWTVGSTVVSTNANYTFTITNTQKLTANFVKLGVLSVTPDFVTATTSAGSGTFTVSNTGGGSMNWTAVSDVFWITIKSGASGVNDGTITVNYTANNSAARVGTVTITAPGATNGVKSVEVRQAARVTAVEDLDMGIPAAYKLEQNYPNPFNPSTKIRYGLPQESNVVVTIFNVLGAEVARFNNGTEGAGFHEVTFDAKNLPSGLYIYRISAGEFIQVKKMLLMK